MKVKDKEKLNNPMKGWQIQNAISLMVFSHSEMTGGQEGRRTGGKEDRRAIGQVERRTCGGQEEDRSTGQHVVRRMKGGENRTGGTSH